MSRRWQVAPGTKLDLSKVEAASLPHSPGGREEVEAALPGAQEELAAYQDKLWAESRRALLVVLQAMDAGGKDGTIKHVFKGVNPQGTRVTSFKVPTKAELAHDFLWRVHAAVPASGEIGIFNRSHYEDVLVVRVHHLVEEKTWRKRFGEINEFEKTLSSNDVRVVKIFLHISKEEQRRRLQQRIEDPNKRWKLSQADLDERGYWTDYQAAYEDAITATSTEVAPWYLVPADHKWYRNWAVSRILIDVLAEMDPSYPEPQDLRTTTVE